MSNLFHLWRAIWLLRKTTYSFAKWLVPLRPYTHFIPIPPRSRDVHVKSIWKKRGGGGGLRWTDTAYLFITLQYASRPKSIAQPTQWKLRKPRAWYIRSFATTFEFTTNNDFATISMFATSIVLPHLSYRYTIGKVFFIMVGLTPLQQTEWLFVNPLQSQIYMVFINKLYVWLYDARSLTEWRYNPGKYDKP